MTYKACSASCESHRVATLYGPHQRPASRPCRKPLRGISVGLCAALFLSALISGCGGADQQPESQVAGTVTFDGSPVKAGLINFEASAAGHAAQAKIEDGSFKVEAPIPPGSYKVSVTPPASGPPVPGESSPLPEAADIPEKYRTLESSDLKAEIREGDNNLEFKLTP
ncbi:MAG: hypothetical protein KDA79_08055 [Planctomycetaceae bacterium]|nr:hypothetical protein [Planctomycetaceae bacterium]